jgi:hypothetical protein
MTKQTKSLALVFWNFIEKNPKLAADIAFQVGVLAGVASKEASRLLAKKRPLLPKHIPDLVPKMLTAAALKYLPGHSPKLQPRKQTQRKRLPKNPTKKL